MREEDLRAFAERDWARVEQAKLAYWAKQYAERGPAPAMHAAEMLRLHVQAHARGSMGAQRRQDLADHIRLKRRIDAASAWFRPKDLDDAAALLSLPASKLDAAEIEELTRALSQALADDGVLANLSEARRRAGRLRRRSLRPGRPATKTKRPGRAR